MRSRRSPHERGEALQRQREVRAALVRRERVDLVDDHRARGRQHRAAGVRAEQDVERLRRGDQDVRRRCGACGRARPAACRRCAPRCGCRRPAAPARAAPRGCRRAAPPGCAGCRSTAPSAARRRRPGSRPRAGPPAPCRTRPSIAARKAASVLPEPVGAAISTCRPAWIAGQACACAAVGAGKLRSNHAATAGWNKVVRSMRPTEYGPVDRGINCGRAGIVRTMRRRRAHGRRVARRRFRPGWRRQSHPA